MKLNIVMPMAGRGIRLANHSSYPKPLTRVLGKTIVEWSVETLGLKGNYIFCCKKEHIEEFNIDKTLKSIVPSCQIVSIDYQTRGTVQSVLEASSIIDNDDELIISDTDHYLVWDHNHFNKEIRSKDIDACLMVFPEKYYSTKASYVKLNKDGYVIEAAEKNPISTIASVGLHYYKKGSEFVKFANELIRRNITYNNEFYVTPVYNLFVESGKKVITNPVTKMWALGSPDELELFMREYKDYYKN
jgi:choline kinase